MQLKNLSKTIIGLGQALAVFVYCSLIAFVMQRISTGLPMSNSLLGPTLMLLLLVFSAGLTGSLVFGYPVYLVINHRIKEGLAVLAYTFLFLFIILLLVGIFFLRA